MSRPGKLSSAEIALTEKHKQRLNTLIRENWKAYNPNCREGDVPQIALVLQDGLDCIFVVGYNKHLLRLKMDIEDPRSPFRLVDKFLIDLYKSFMDGLKPPNGFWAIHRRNLNQFVVDRDEDLTSYFTGVPVEE